MSDDREATRPERSSSNVSEWTKRTLEPALGRRGERDVEFSTVSSLESNTPSDVRMPLETMVR